MKKSTFSEKQLKELKAIVSLAPGFKKQGKLGAYIDLWLVCEVLAKKYIMYHKKQSEIPVTWSYIQLTSALNYYSVSYDIKMILAAFKSGSKGKRGNKSARQLRNAYLHTIAENDRKEIEQRNRELISLLTFWVNKLSNAT